MVHFRIELALQGPDPISDKSGWQRMLWLYQPRDLLSRQSIALRRAEPGQVLSDPERFDKLNNAPRAWRSFRTIRRR